MSPSTNNQLVDRLSTQKNARPALAIRGLAAFNRLIDQQVHKTVLRFASAMIANLLVGWLDVKPC